MPNAFAIDRPICFSTYGFNEAVIPAFLICQEICCDIYWGDRAFSYFDHSKDPLFSLLLKHFYNDLEGETPGL
ncbi:MAG: hypothetical protein EZS28_019055 [Streblomastix strix]|uniref:Uncharacterized protein n=1 Tax=Streblomastix strix TaxID=222440 RepID=A0A5J4VSW4_9EUKA|nr:MAG: hypothetical protein EZS28_019055 [Streblomastix strix]